MNKEVIKAMNKKEKRFSNLRKWWHKNSYKFFRVILFPIWIVAYAHEKFISYLNSKQVWNEDRAKEILNYYIPRRAEWNEEKKEFYLFDNGYGWYFSYAKRYLKRKDYRFWKCNTYNIKKYLVNHFELDGFTKKNLGTIYDNNWTELIFKMN